MDHKFTEQIKQWLETPSSERDYSVGALYLLKLSACRFRSVAEKERCSKYRAKERRVKLALTMPNVADIMQHRTNGTDAFDTLYIGAEKFPFHDSFTLSMSGRVINIFSIFNYFLVISEIITNFTPHIVCRSPIWARGRDADIVKKRLLRFILDLQESRKF